MNIQNYLLNTSFWELMHFFVPRLVIAIICGTMIGIERELKGKSAGLRTCILICIGSTLFSSIASLINDTSGTGDPTRIAAQIVSGIGFLGGGVIIHSQGSVYGITTAAAIWLVAAIGVTIGIELYPVALFTSALCVAVLIIARKIEVNFTDKLNKNNKIYFVEIVTKKSLNEIEEIYKILKDLNLDTSELTVLKDFTRNVYSIKTYKGQEVTQALADKDWVIQITNKPV
jgi:putative Mg2+ transporter-C (MgtC) family protein